MAVPAGTSEAAANKSRQPMSTDVSTGRKARFVKGATVVTIGEEWKEGILRLSEELNACREELHHAAKQRAVAEELFFSRLEEFLQNRLPETGMPEVGITAETAREVDVAFCAVKLAHGADCKEFYAEGEVPEVEAEEALVLAGELDDDLEDGEINGDRTTGANGAVPERHADPLLNAAEIARLSPKARDEAINQQFDVVIERAIKKLPLTQEEIDGAKQYRDMRRQRAEFAAPLRAKYLSAKEKELGRVSASLLSKVWRYAQMLWDGRVPKRSEVDEWDLKPLNEEQLALPRYEVRRIIAHYRDLHRKKLQLSKGEVHCGDAQGVGRLRVVRTYVRRLRRFLSARERLCL